MRFKVVAKFVLLLFSVLLLITVNSSVQAIDPDWHVVTSVGELEAAITDSPTDGTLKVIYLVDGFVSSGTAFPIGGGRNIELRSSPNSMAIFTHSSGHNFTVSGGDARLHLVNIIVDGAGGSGHGVLIGANNYFEMTNSTIRNNGGWGVHDYGGDMIINSGTIAYNQEGGIRLGGRAGAVVTMHGGEIRDNLSSGVHAGAHSTFIMNDGLITRNQAVYGAGILIGGINGGPGQVSINGGTISYNVAYRYGGGIFAQSITMPNPATAPLINMLYTTLNINNSTIISNSAGVSGGAIGVGGMDLTFPLPEPPIPGLLPIGGPVAEMMLIDMFFDEIFPATFNIQNTLIENNTATNYGGGIHLGFMDATMSSGSTTVIRPVYSTLNVQNGVTFRNNRAGRDGGAIFATDYEYRYNLSSGAYSQLVVDSPSIFNGNLAGHGAFHPPGNPDVTNIEASSTSIFSHPLNNHDINFRFDEEIDDALRITFDTAGGGDNPPTQHFPYNPNRIPERPNDPVRPGYIFAGWYIDYGTWNQPFDFDRPVERNYDLHARWLPIEDVEPPIEEDDEYEYSAPDYEYIPDLDVDGMTPEFGPVSPDLEGDDAPDTESGTTDSDDEDEKIEPTLPITGFLASNALLGLPVIALGLSLAVIKNEHKINY